MPHKRAKRSVRDQKRTQSGDDLAPAAKRAIESEDIPKSVARVLNAAKVQQDWAERKRKGVESETAGPSRKKRKRDGEGDGEGKAKEGSQIRIMPGESMAHFNRRVEDSMRQSVRAAMLASSARMRQARKEEVALKSEPQPSVASDLRSKRSSKSEDNDDGDGDDDSPLPQKQTKRDKPKEFEKISSSAPKRLNDIVQAPPELKKLPRKAKKLAEQKSAQKGERTKSLSEGVLSMAQKAMLEGERERAIRLYREMKKGRTSG